MRRDFWVGWWMVRERYKTFWIMSFDITGKLGK